MNLKLVGLLALCGAVVVACGDSDSDNGGGGEGGGTTTDGGNGTGGDGVGNTINVGGMGTGGDGGGTSIPGCYDEGAALVAPGETSAVGLNVCTEAQVDGFFTACFDGDQTTCDAFLDPAAMNGVCAGCIFGLDDLSAAQPMATGNIPPLIQSEMFAYVNVLACESAAQNLPQCAAPTSQLLFCAQTACEACEQGGAEQDDCVNYAASLDGICGQLVTIPTECEPILTGTESSPQCDGADFETLYGNVTNYFCGAPQ